MTGNRKCHTGWRGNQAAWRVTDRLERACDCLGDVSGASNRMGRAALKRKRQTDLAVTDDCNERRQGSRAVPTAEQRRPRSQREEPSDVRRGGNRTNCQRTSDASLIPIRVIALSAFRQLPVFLHSFGGDFAVSFRFVCHFCPSKSVSPKPPTKHRGLGENDLRLPDEVDF